MPYFHAALLDSRTKPSCMLFNRTVVYSTYVPSNFSLSACGARIFELNFFTPGD